MDNLNKQTHRPIYLVFLGPPGSGKGTQADRLHEEKCWVHLSSGDLFRENIAKGTGLGRQVKDTLARGALVPDALTIKMVMNRLHEPDTELGVIFDGFPRTRAQAEALDCNLEREGKHIRRAVYFRLADEVIVDRLSARRVCPLDGAVYNLISRPPKLDEFCDNDQVKLVQRDDDKPEVIRKRLDVYRELTTPVVDFYRDKGLLLEIDAAGEIEAVTQELKNMSVLFENGN